MDLAYRCHSVCFDALLPSMDSRADRLVGKSQSLYQCLYG